MTRALLLCLLVLPAFGESGPDKPAILKAYYEALEATTQAHASDTFRAAMDFVEKGGMDKEIHRRICDLLKLDPKLAEYDIRHVLATRSRRDLEKWLLRKTYGKLTCLFVAIEAWVPAKKDKTKPQQTAWEKKVLTDAQKERVWKWAGQSIRQEAILAHYGRLHGRHMKSWSDECKRCKGDAHGSYNSAGKAGALKREDLDWWGSTCSKCLGVGLVVTVEFD